MKFVLHSIIDFYIKKRLFRTLLLGSLFLLMTGKLEAQCIIIRTITGPTPVCTATTGNVYTTESGMSEYFWTISSGGIITDGVGTNSITVTWNSAGSETISVNYKDTDGCTAASPALYDVMVNPLPANGLTVGGTGLICTGTGTNITVSSSEIGTSYQLRNNAGNVNVGPPVSGDGALIDLPTGIITSTTAYNVYATNGCGSDQLTGTAVVTVNPLPAIGLTVGGTGSICTGTGTNITVAASEIGTSYQLRNNAGNVNVGSPVSGDGALIDLPTGNLTSTTTYNVYATNGCGSDQLTETAVVTVNPLPAIGLTVGGTGSICTGTGTNITVAASEIGTSYQLRNNLGNVNVGSPVPGDGALIDLPTGNITSTTTYNVYATNGCGSDQLTGTAVVTVNPLPAIGLTVGGTGSICTGTGTNITVSASELGTSYQLRNNLGNVNVGSPVPGDGALIDLPTGNLTSTTTYNVYATNGCGSDQLTETAVVTVNPLPAIGLTVGGTGSICTGTGTNITVAASEIGTSYQLRNNAGNVNVGSPVSGDGALIDLPTGNITSTTTYNVYATNGCGSDQLTETAVVTVNPLPAIGLTVGGTGSICTGTGTNITVAASEIGTSYQLRNNLGNVNVGSPVPGDGALIDLPTGNITSTTTYNVYATNGCGSDQLTGTAVVTVNPLPAIGLTVGGTGSICTGTGTNITVSASELGTSYQLRNNLGNVNVGSPVPGDGALIDLPTGNLTSTTTYNVYATNGCGSDQLTETAVVTVNPLPAIGLTVGGTGSICTGTGTNITVAASEIGTSYQLRNNAGNVNVGSPVSGDGALIDLPTGNITSTTTYNVYATNGCGSDQLTETAVVTVNPLPAIGLTVGGTGSICTGTGTNITVAASEIGTSYQLRNNLGNVNVGSPVPGDGALIDLPTGNITSTTTYNVYATNGCGSDQLTGTAVVTVNPLPAIGLTVGGTGSICTGTGTNITVSASELGTSYQLRNNLGNVNVGSPVPGDGALIDLPTGNLTSTTTYNVYATNGCGSDQLTETAVVTVNALPATPTASVTVQPTCAVPTGTIVITAPTGAQYEYALDLGTYQAGATFTLVSVGNHTVTARLAASPTCVSTASSSMTVNAVPTVPATPTASVTVQPTCAVPTGTIVITAPTGAQYEYALDLGTYQAGATFTLVSVGNHTVTARLAASPTCVSTASSSMTVNAVPTVPATPTASVTVQPTCAVPTGTIVITAPTGAQYEYALDLGTYQAGATFTLVSVGNHTVTARLAASPTCVSTASSSMTVNAVPTVPATPTASVTVQPTCAVPTGTIVITAPTGAQYEYALDLGTYQAGATFTLVSVGNHTVTARLAASPTCVSTASSSMTVNAVPTVPATPTASVTVQPTCAVPTGTIVITAPTGAQYEYALDLGTYQAGATFTLVSVGNHTVTARLAASPTCVSTASSSMTVNAVPTVPATPTASVTVQPTCAVPTGTIVITAPTGAQYEYALDLGTYQAGATFTLVSVGNHTVTARLAASPTCVSTASSSMTVNAVPTVPATPTASVTVQPTCAVPTGTIVITAPTGAQYEYALDLGTYQAGATFTLVSVGNHTVTARLAASPTCVSTASSSMTVNAVPTVPATPTASVTVQPTCAVPTGTIVITAPTGAQYEYALDLGTYQAGATFTLVSVGNHTVTARLAASPTCVSTASSSMTVNAVPTVPATPTASVTVQPTCAVPTGTIVITAPTGAQYEYALDLGTYQAGATFTLVSVGNHTVTARLAASPTCVSTASSSMTVNAVPTVPATPTASVTVQPTCAVPTGTIVITAPTGAQYEYALDLGTYQAGATFTLVSVGNHTVTARLAASPTCVSTASSSMTVNAVPTVPATPTASVTVQPTCAVPTGTIVITAPTGAQYEYALDLGTYQAGATFTLVSVGNHTVTARLAASPTCVSTASSSMTVNAVPTVPATPTASVTVQPTCAVPTGTIVITAPTGAQYEYALDLGTYQAGATFTLVSVGNHTVTARLAASPTCVSTASSSMTVNAVPTVPATPTASVTVQPTCAVPTGTIVITAPTGAQYEYALDLGTYQAGATFTLVSVGNHTVTARLAASPTCVSTASSSMTVNAVPTVPATPTASVTVQPTCAVPTGTIVITAPTGAQYEYALDLGTYQAGATFTLVSVGNHTVTARLAASPTCVSTASSSMTVNAVPTVPATPTASVTVQPTCAVPTGTIVITAPTGAQYEYALDLGTYQAGATFTLVSVGNHTVTARLAASPTCVSTASSSMTVNAVPTVPATPTASVTVQPTCAVPTGTIVITAPTGAQYEYALDLGTYQAGATFTLVSVGNHTVTARLAASPTCVSTASSSMTVNAVPTVPATPTASVTVQPTCAVPTGTIVITAPTGAQYEYALDLGTYQAGATFTLVSVGNHTVTARLAASPTCVSTASSSMTVNAQPVTPAAPTGTASQAFCSGASPMVANLTATGTAIQWYAASSGGTALATSTALVTATHYYASQTVGGCESTSRFDVTATVNTTPATSNITGSNTPACSGTGYIYSVIFTAGSSYAWTVPSGASITAGAGTNSITVSFGTTNGNVTVTETNAAGCTGIMKTLAVSLAGCNLNANFSGSPLTICVGSTVTFTNISTGTSGSTTYFWNFGSGASPATANTVGPHTVTYNTSGSKTITLVITDGASDTEIKADYIIVTPNVTIAPFIPATSNRCQGSGTVTYTTTATNSTGITYSLDPTSITGGNTINPATGDVTYASGWNGTTIITASAAGCGGPVTATHTVTITPTASVSSVTGTSPLCTGSTATYTANGAVLGGGTGAWSSSNIAIASVNSATGFVTGIGAGSCNIIYTITGGCGGTKTAQQAITILPNASITSVAGTTPLCIGGSATYTITGAVLGGGTGAWSSSNTAIATVNGSGIVTGVAAGTCNIIYTITGGCGGIQTAQQTITITPNVSGLAFTLGSASVRCQGSGIVTYTATATNTTGITYSLDAASLSGGNTIVLSTGTVTYLSTWTGTTTITASAAGCSGPVIATHIVTINALPIITGTTPASRCGTGTVTLGATASASTINWYSALTGGSSLGTGNTFITPGLTSTTTYYVDATNNGCTTTTRTAVIATVNALPTPTITGPATACVYSMGNVYATQTGMTNYAWTVSTGGVMTAGGGTTNNTVTVTWNTPGAKTVSVNYTNTNGCTATSPIAYNVTVNDLPVATSVSITGTMVTGNTLTGSYTYSDIENDPQGTSTYRWLRADDITGLGETGITGATGLSYVLVAADEGKYISFEVSPVASSGCTPGVAVKSAYQWNNSVTFNVSFTTGWNWFSVNTILSDMTLGKVLPSVNTNGDYIKNQVASATYYTGFGWFGTLTTIDPTKLHKLKIQNSSNISFSGVPVNVNSTQIALVSGWNWIGYLPQKAQSLTDALSSLILANLDYIKNQTKSATYYTAFGWFGSLTQLSPTEGYMIKLTNPGTLKYPDIKNKGDANASQEITESSFNPNDYEFNGSVTASVFTDGVLTGSENDLLFAYVNNELRGVTRSHYFSPSKINLFPIMIHSNLSEGEIVKFKYFNTEQNKFYPCRETITFSKDMIVADAYNSFKLNVNASTKIEDTLSVNDDLRLNFYPNPFDHFLNLEYSISKQTHVRLAIFDSNGKLIQILVDGEQKPDNYLMQWNSGPSLPGMYLIKFQAGSKQKTQKVILYR